MQTGSEAERLNHFSIVFVGDGFLSRSWMEENEGKEKKRQ